MNDIRLSFEYKYRSIHSYLGKDKLSKLLTWNNESDCYEDSEVELNYFWYFKGWQAGEQG